uniref:2'-5' RNA ligase family protein n=1 Tax=Micromonospora sp. NBC_00855 TaxID=2975978 RepID=UPI0022501761|nr:2'-5' RNA ligase family protein [Micromonospora sp. NBC_00855]
MSAPVIEAPETEPLADAPPPRWRGLLMPVNTPSGDKRQAVLVGDEAPQRPLPLPLSAQYELDDGHKGSVVIGLIDRLWVQEGAVWGEGPFDLADPVAADWAAKVGRGVAGWVSTDLSDVAITEVPLDENGVDVTEAFEQWLRADPETTPPEPPVKSWLYRIDEWKIMGVTLLSSPAFEQARIEPVYDGAGLTAAGDDDQDDGTTVHTGAMVALVPAAEDAARLAVEGGEPVEELHLTLAYLGEAADWTPEQADAVHTAVADLLAGPVLGEVWAHASFNPDSTDKDPCAVYLAGADGLAELHAAVVAAAGETGGPVPDQHSPWIPHITAGYGLDVSVLSETGPIRFDRLRVAFGGKARDIPLESVTAALTAAAVTYPHADFMLPEPDELTAITVTDDGCVFGHLAEYGSCHIGFADVCVTPPTSSSDYAYFHQGEISTDAGPLAVGKITLGTGHASMRASARAAAEHYDNTGSAVAVVRCRDGALGPWLSGRILPGVTDERVDELRRSGVSGDWRGIRRGSRTLELVGVLAVNVPGFPVPRTRALAASGVRSLVAAGVRRQHRIPEPKRLVLADVLRASRVRAVTDRMRSARLQVAGNRIHFKKERRVRSEGGVRKYKQPKGEVIRKKPKEPPPPSTNSIASMPRIRELFETDDRELRDVVAQGLDGDYGYPDEEGNRLQLRVDMAARMTIEGRRLLRIEGDILDGGTGEPVGRTERNFYLDSDGDPYVEHALLSLNPEAQDRGFGTQYSNELLDYYRASEVSRITLAAGLEDGGWTWARAGYDWNDATPEMVTVSRSNLMNRMMALRTDSGTSESDRAALDEVMMRMAGPMSQWPRPREISELTGDVGNLGEQILRGSDWYGVRWL